MAEARVSQVAVEVLHKASTPVGRVTQVAVEILMPPRRFVPQIIRRR